MPALRIPILIGERVALDESFGKTTRASFPSSSFEDSGSEALGSLRGRTTERPRDPKSKERPGPGSVLSSCCWS